VGIESGKHNFVACLGSPLGDLGISGGLPVEGPKLVFGKSPAKIAVAAVAGAAGAVGQKRWVKKT
jgi:hypothetical protein